MADTLRIVTLIPTGVENSTGEIVSVKKDETLEVPAHAGRALIAMGHAKPAGEPPTAKPAAK